MKICMLVRNTFTHDTRVIKEARSLIGAGNEVTVIALRGEGLPEYENRQDKISVCRVGEMRQHSRLRSQTLPARQSHRLKSFPNAVLRVGGWLPTGMGVFFYQARALRWLMSFLALPILLLLALPYLSVRWSRSIMSKMTVWTRNGLLFSRDDDEFVRAGMRCAPDVIHAHDLNTLFPAVVLARKTGASLVYDSHELYVDRNAQESLWLRLRWIFIEAQTIREADEVITVSDSIAEVLAGRYKINKPTVVRNVQEYVKSGGKISLRDLPALRGVRPDDRIAVYAGRITSGRGLGILVEASQYLEKVVIVLLGNQNPPYAAKLRAMVGQLGVEDKVLFSPPVESDEVNDYVSSADVGLMLTENVCLSYFYGAGNKLFHYLMAGVPVIVSDQPEKRKIVETYKVGRFCSIGEAREVARVIQELADDAEARERYSANALESAKSLNWENEEKKLLAVYERIAAGNKKCGL